MIHEKIGALRSTGFRKNGPKNLKIEVDKENFHNIFLINGINFKTEGISRSDLLIKPGSFYMIINNGNCPLDLYYNQDISNHLIIYDPFKYESSQKIPLSPEIFKKRYNIPKGYIDTLPKWYSFKFSYPNYNLIFVRPEYGLSIQLHQYRNEVWKILEGEPIIINRDRVYYFVKTGTIFQNPINTYHSVINPNKEKNKFVILKESWNGLFDERDINRVFNPNKYE
ncbi:MAG: hypothetical protein ACFE9Q_03040 [Candidatus Hodarchaeota archaeon]